MKKRVTHPSSPTFTSSEAWQRRHFLQSVGGAGLVAAATPWWAGCGSDNSASSSGTAADVLQRIADAGAPPVNPAIVPPSDLENMPPSEGKWWLRDNYYPINDEIEAFDLLVEGNIPPELNGLFMRNGPNPPNAESGFWLFGDGMMHGVRIENGKALWYRNRYIKTKALNVQDGLVMTANRANTSFVTHGNKTLALYEGGLPYEVNPKTLETITEYNYGDQLVRPMSAHPKIDPVTGELCFMSYFFFPPFVTYHTVDPTGQKLTTHEVPWDKERGVMMHDFQLTETHAIILDLPLTLDLQLAIDNQYPFVWDPTHGARFGLLPRNDINAGVTWVDVDPCFVFHTFNAYNDPNNPDTVIFEGARMKDAFAGGDPTDVSQPAMHYRWSIDTKNRTASETQLDDQGTDFPRMNERYQGQNWRYSYSLRMQPGSGSDAIKPIAILKHDRQTDKRDVWEMPEHKQPDEALFVPISETGAEDEGYLLSMVYDKSRNGSEVAILDATNISAGPIATIYMPRRVPYGFHGSWIPTTPS